MMMILPLSFKSAVGPIDENGREHRGPALTANVGDRPLDRPDADVCAALLQ